MIRWHVHLVWAAVAVVFGIALSQFMVGRRDAEDRRTRQVLEAEIDQLESKIEDLEGPIPEPESANGTVEEPEKKAPVPQKPADRLAQIRKWIKSGGRRDSWRALKAIGELKDRNEKVALLKEVFAGKNDRLKRGALSLLTDLGDPEATAFAVDVLNGKGSDWLKARAASVLGNLSGNGDAILALEKTYNSANMSLQVYAASSLNQLGNHAPLQQMVVKIGPMLDDADGAKREYAAELLGRLGTPAVLPELGRALQDPNTNVRDEALEALGRTGLKEAIPLIKPFLKDPNPRLRSEAKEAIENIQKKR